MTDIPKDLLLQQGRLVLALILSPTPDLAWLLLRMALAINLTVPPAVILEMDEAARIKPSQRILRNPVPS
jgi:hypothetical protein